jgi:hypothetical protein
MTVVYTNSTLPNDLGPVDSTESISTGNLHDKVSETEIAALPELQQPLVFQCKKCLLIVGDSSKLFSAIGAHRMIVLEEKSEAITTGNDPIVQPDPEAFDYMSTCFLLYCSKCQELLGRSYISGNVNMMHLIQKYILDTDTLQCYELGSPIIRQNSVYDIPSALSLQKQIIQLQRFCLTCRDKIQRLETELQKSRIISDAQAPKTPNRRKSSTPIRRRQVSNGPSSTERSSK